MRSFHFLFVVLLLLCALVLYMSTLEEVHSQRGVVHADFETMQQAGAPEARHGSIVWFGWAYGALVITFFIGLIDLALARGGKPGPAAARRTVWILGGVLQLVFLALVQSYRSFMVDPLQPPVLFFPEPTSWMMYGIWGFPMLFVALYILKFETWILTPEEEAEFAKLEAKMDAERLEARALAENQAAKSQGVAS